jgi:hypothetical protein
MALTSASIDVEVIYVMFIYVEAFYPAQTTPPVIPSNEPSEVRRNSHVALWVNYLVICYILIIFIWRLLSDPWLQGWLLNPGMWSGTSGCFVSHFWKEHNSNYHHRSRVQAASLSIRTDCLSVIAFHFMPKNIYFIMCRCCSCTESFIRPVVSGGYHQLCRLVCFM